MEDMMTMAGFSRVYDSYIRDGYTGNKAYELTEQEFQKRHNTAITKFSSYESFKVCRSMYYKRHGRV